MTDDPIGPARSELDPENPREAVIMAGRARLVTRGLDALRSQLNASILSSESPVSRDTAYRVFRNDEEGPVSDAITAAVADAIHDPAWSGYNAALQRSVEAYQASVNREESPATSLTAALEANFEAQFMSPGVPAAMLVTAAASTASSAWKGEGPSERDRALAQQMLESRQAFYSAMTDHFVSLLTYVSSDLGRRPRSGVDLQTIATLLHALSDGAVQRRLIDPDALTTRTVAEAMLLLGLAFTEVGPAADPRRPEDERGQEIFDQVLVGAGQLWQSKPEVTVDAAASVASVPSEAAVLLFPQVGDLVDSLLRARVVGGGFAELGPLPDAGSARQLLPTLVAALQRMRDLADSTPYAVAAAAAKTPSRSTTFADDFVAHYGVLVEALGTSQQPDQLVSDLLTFASQGRAHWGTVTALLRTVGYDHDA